LGGIVCFYLKKQALPSAITMFAKGQRHSGSLGGCPLYPRKRTSVASESMSALGHFRTHAPQHRAVPLFDHLVGLHLGDSG
jgi:hypothetical protein